MSIEKESLAYKKISLLVSLCAIIGSLFLIVTFEYYNNPSFDLKLRENRVALLKSYQSVTQEDKGDYRSFLQIVSGGEKLQRDWLTRDRKFIYALFFISFILSVVLFGCFCCNKKVRDALQVGHQLMNTEIYKTLFDNTSDAVLIIEDNKFVNCNKATLDLLGYAITEKNSLLDTHPSELSPLLQSDGQESVAKAELMIAKAYKEGNHRFEWTHYRRNGEVFPVEVVLTSIPVGIKNYLHVVWRDITERKQAEAKIHYQANYDLLTKLPNRTLFMDRLEQAILYRHDNNSYHALLFLDLDLFKSINDTLGHHIGDKLLMKVASRLLKQIRPQDTAARLGGDEFVILLTSLHPRLHRSIQIVQKMATGILNELQKIFKINQYELSVSASIGIKMFPVNEESKDDILKHADIAMYHSKENGRGIASLYLPEMEEKISKRMILENDLKEALANDEFVIYYQPIMNSDLQIAKVEALVRWLHKDRGLIPPDFFISVAEDTGLIHDLGKLVLEKAITEITAINKELNFDLKLAVNISPIQFNDESFVETVESLVNGNQLAAHFLTLELTENVLIENMEGILNKISRLKQLGLKFSLDDFGTGFSSLSYLKKLPLDEIKIDRNFVLDLQSDMNSTVLVKTIINIAHQFGLEVVAEGVEKKMHEDFLKKENCDFYQGYLYSKPISLTDLRTYLLS